MPTSPNRGRFITLEGGEGAGKSTQLRRLNAALNSSDLTGEINQSALLARDLMKKISPDTPSILKTREPGGSPGAEEIRALLVNGEPGRWSCLTEALLHFAARRDHVERTIWPALDAGYWVVCDRFFDSTMAYQGYGLGLDHGVIKSLRQITLGNFQPDLTVILDIDVEIGLKRAVARHGGEDRYEKMDLAFHQRMREGFLEIANQEPRRCVVVDADADPDTVQARIWDAVSSRLGLTS